jgi:hypothetical protein
MKLDSKDALLTFTRSDVSDLNNFAFLISKNLKV